MKSRNGSLFLKIFLWFWATVIVTGIALVVTFILQPGRMSSRWHNSLTRAVDYSGAIAVEEAELLADHRWDRATTWLQLAHEAHT